jgi:hypothetical protein
MHQAQLAQYLRFSHGHSGNHAGAFHFRAILNLLQLFIESKMRVRGRACCRTPRRPSGVREEWMEPAIHAIVAGFWNRCLIASNAYAETWSGLFAETNG